jgi:hypothetical protein
MCILLAILAVPSCCCARRRILAQQCLVHDYERRRGRTGRDHLRPDWWHEGMPSAGVALV